MVSRLETGINVLDRKLNGGVPPGYLVAYTANPASQSELLLYELTAARDTLYLTTERSADVVHHAIEESPSAVGNPTVRRIAGDAAFENALRLIRALPDESNLIIDTVDFLEQADTDDYIAFLNDLKAVMLETDSIAVLHGLKGTNEPANRTRTEHAADAIFDLRTRVAGSELETHLAIPKFRSGGQPTEAIKLELTEEVAIDTSRDIA